MGWMQALVEVYDRCAGDPALIGEETPLLPLCHMTNQAQIEITLDGDGGLLSAEAVPKSDQTTVIPCTEKSGSRTSGLSPHPLADKLQYVAKDYSSHVDAKKSGYSLYHDLLASWCSSSADSKVKSVLKYVESGAVMDDLIGCGILIADRDGKVLRKKSADPDGRRAEDSPLFAVSKINGEQYDAFVRWRVDIPGDPVKDLCRDRRVQDSWIAYCTAAGGDRGLCYVTGRDEILASQHPMKIRNAADRAKLISSNDSQGYTFRGRFITAGEACGIGNITTQKAHSALRWLIARQGYHDGDMTIVSWSDSGARPPSPMDDLSLFGEAEAGTGTGVEEARSLNSRIRGYPSKILDEKVCFMALDSATPGRLSILTFREWLGEDYIAILDDWQASLAWQHTYASRKREDGTRERVRFVGAPSPRDIAKAAYGEKADQKTLTSTVQRILPCILDRRKLPKDIVDAAVRRASNPVAMERWEHNKVLTIACSLHKHISKEEYSMTLEEGRRSRDYLYGRLLAVADLLESAALSSAGEMRQTTAVRMMQRFSEFPFSTWRDIEVALVPYMARLGPKSRYYEMKMAKIMDLFVADEFTDNSKLSGEFLLGYHCQKEDQFRKKTEE